jgi:hypothetical protein
MGSIINWYTQYPVEMKGRRGKRRMHLLDDLKEGEKYCKLKEEALYHAPWRTRFGRDYGTIVRQTRQ